MSTKNTGKGCRLSLYEKIYRELDSTMIGAERQRNVSDGGAPRYDMYNEMRADYKDNEYYIIVHSENKNRLDFAQRVAEYYGADFFYKDNTWRKSDPSRNYEIWIHIPESGY